MFVQKHESRGKYGLGKLQPIRFHETEFAVVHDNTVEVIGVISSYFGYATHTRVVDARADVAVAVARDFNSVSQKVNHLVLDCTYDQPNLIVSDDIIESVIGFVGYEAQTDFHRVAVSIRK